MLKSMNNSHLTQTPPSLLVNETSTQAVEASVSRRLFLVAIILSALISGTLFGYGGYYLGSNSANINQSKQVDQAEESPAVSVMFEAQDIVSTGETIETKEVVVERVENSEQGELTEANLMGVKAALPENWSMEVVENTQGTTLMISPDNAGGFIAIRAHDYVDTGNMQAYYCSIHEVCIPAMTEFIETPIGNIVGYKATPVDNSGGGRELFGVKDGKMYTLSVSTPSVPEITEFEMHSAEVLESLVF